MYIHVNTIIHVHVQKHYLLLLSLVIIIKDKIYKIHLHVYAVRNLCDILLQSHHYCTTCMISVHVGV